MKAIKIGLDCDGVLSSFVDAVLERARQMGLEEHFPTCAEDVNCWDISEKFQEVMKDAWTDEKFWLNLKPMLKEIPFTPNCYITSRFVPSEITAKWLKKHKFPVAEVITVKKPEEKVQHALDRGLDIFVDDYYPTVHAMRKAGVNCLLFEQPYQRGHAKECKGLPVITKLEEVFKYI